MVQACTELPLLAAGGPGVPPRSGPHCECPRVRAGTGMPTCMLTCQKLVTWPCQAVCCAPCFVHAAPCRMVVQTLKGGGQSDAIFLAGRFRGLPCFCVNVWMWCWGEIVLKSKFNIWWAGRSVGWLTMISSWSCRASQTASASMGMCTTSIARSAMRCPCHWRSRWAASCALHWRTALASRRKRCWPPSLAENCRCSSADDVTSSPGS